jgi:hypothetical protein
MPRRRATSEMRHKGRPGKESDAVDKFFLLDMSPGFL